MKKPIIYLLPVFVLFVSCFKSASKSGAADPSDRLLFSKRSFSNDIINQLKATETVFFLKNSDSASVDSLKQAISAAWDLTPLIFDDLDTFDQYASNPKYSYFIIEGVTTTTTSGTGSYSNTHYYLTLRLFKDVDRKKRVQTNGLCRIELYPNSSTMWSGRSSRKANDVINELYKKGVFYNWSPILLKAQLQVVSANLKNNIRPWLFEEVKSSSLTQLLSADTLYVPKRLLMSFNAFSGREKAKEDNPFSGYKYPYRLCTDSELYDIFQTQNRGRFLFEYVKSSTDKFVVVYDMKEKNIIYKEYTPTSYNLKDKDIERIK